MAFSVLRAILSAPEFVYLAQVPRTRGVYGRRGHKPRGSCDCLGRAARTTRLTQQRAGLDRQLELLTWLDDDHRYG